MIEQFFGIKPDNLEIIKREITEAENYLPSYWRRYEPNLEVVLTDLSLCHYNIMFRHENTPIFANCSREAIESRVGTFGKSFLFIWMRGVLIKNDDLRETLSELTEGIQCPIVSVDMRSGQTSALSWEEACSFYFPQFILGQKNDIPSTIMYLIESLEYQAMFS